MADYDETEFVHGDYYDDDRDFCWLQTPDPLMTEILNRLYHMERGELERLLEQLKAKEASSK